MTTLHTLRHAPPKGQALSEFLLVVLALLPLWWVLPMLDKYQQIAHATLLASRYAAFDVGWFPAHDTSRAKPSAQQQSELAQRFLAHPWAPITSSTPTAAPGFTPHPAWRTPDGRPLLPQAADLALRIRHDPVPLPAFDAASNTLASPQAMALSPASLTQASLSVPLANAAPGLSLFEPFDRLDLRIHAHTAILHGAWTARSPEAVEQTVAQLTPLRALVSSGLSSTLSAALPWFELDSVRAPQLDQLPLWRDLVPTDRLHTGTP
jgi:hypothetical protein